MADVLKFPPLGPFERRFDALFHELFEAHRGFQAKRLRLVTRESYDICHPAASREVNRLRELIGLAPLVDIDKIDGAWRSRIGDKVQIIKWNPQGNIVDILYEDYLHNQRAPMRGH